MFTWTQTESDDMSPGALPCFGGAGGQKLDATAQPKSRPLQDRVGAETRHLLSVKAADGVRTCCGSLFTPHRQVPC